MLFVLGDFWKMLIMVTTTWLCYVAAGFEFTMVTMAALMYFKLSSMGRDY